MSKEDRDLIASLQSLVHSLQQRVKVHTNFAVFKLQSLSEALFSYYANYNFFFSVFFFFFFVLWINSVYRVYGFLVTNLEAINQELEAENTMLSSRLSSCRCHEVWNSKLYVFFYFLFSFCYYLFFGNTMYCCSWFQCKTLLHN